MVGGFEYDQDAVEVANKGYEAPPHSLEIEEFWKVRISK
jgi:hypothetical protein